MKDPSIIEAKLKSSNPIKNVNNGDMDDIFDDLEEGC